MDRLDLINFQVQQLIKRTPLHISKPANMQFTGFKPLQTSLQVSGQLLCFFRIVDETQSIVPLSWYNHLVLNREDIVRENSQFIFHCVSNFLSNSTIRFNQFIKTVEDSGECCGYQVQAIDWTGKSGKFEPIEDSFSKWVRETREQNAKEADIR